MNVRVRFAPSPTGYLHIGGARTALFNWLFARHTGGTFILRIEDTDAARNTREAVDVILHGLRWLGLDWDEGPTTGDSGAAAKGAHGPYFQSKRMDRYRHHVEALLRGGKAREHDGAIKFRMPAEPILIPDLVVGDVRRELTDREQLDPEVILFRSDGQPVFHFVNVVDDLEMGITHVIRGEDHLSNTARHIALFRALGAEPPKYAHIPLILNPDGSKMSKRDQGASLTAYDDEGYAPEAVVNFLCLLGWSPKDGREIMSLKEVVERFDLSRVLRHNARFDMTKLQWMNWEYLRTMNAGRFQELAVQALERKGCSVQGYPEPYIQAALATCRDKVKVLSDLPAFVRFYFIDEVTFESGDIKSAFADGDAARLARLREAFAALSPFNADTIAQALKAVAAAQGVKAGVLVHPVRMACTGSKIGPSLYHLMEVLGKDRVLRRLDTAISALS
jgi:glutamyl-tRNA synthetase